MSNASLKEQLQAVASQISDKLPKEQKQHTRPTQVSTPLPTNVSKNVVKDKTTEDTAKKTKPKWLDYVRYGVELLKAYFPAAFKSFNEVKPLKKGIKQDLVKRLSTMADVVTDDKACMVKSLSYYVNTVAYHKSVTKGAVRIDLDGQPAGDVTEEEAKYSLERHQAKAQTRNQAATTAKHEKNDLA